MELWLESHKAYSKASQKSKFGECLESFYLSSSMDKVGLSENPG